MTNTYDSVSYTFIEYNAAFHMKYKHLFVSRVYDQDNIDECPLIITWAETDMKVEEESGKCLAIATQVSYYPDTFKVSEETFENMLQAFTLFPDNQDSNEDNSNLRLELVKALLNS